MKQEPDHYAVLQVDPRAEKEVVQAAYRRLAAKYHPDVDSSPGASDRMKLLNAAYEVLSDPEKRGAYDLRRASRSRQEEGGRRGPSHQWQRWWLLPLVAVILVAAFRSPRLLLILGPLLLVLWLIWSWRSADSG